MLPLDYESDRELLDVALPIIGLTPPLEASILWIRNTLQVAEVECSARYRQEAEQRDDLQVISEPRDFEFDESGNFVPFGQVSADHEVLAQHATP